MSCFCPSPWSYQRRQTREVKVGKIGVGGPNPIRIQSMLTCDTMDTEACIQQTLDLVDVGCEIVRITAPTVKDAKNLKPIKEGLLARGCDVPIVADIHFKPEAAMEAARWVEKVRINPGNYADSKKFAVKEYSGEQYAAAIHTVGAALPAARNQHPDRYQSRLVERSDHEPLRGYPSWNGRERAGVCSNRSRPGVSRFHFLHEGQQPEGDDRCLSLARLTSLSGWT